LHPGYRIFSSLLLTAALATPVAVMAASPSDDNQEHRQAETNKRYYDRHYKDYHTWNSNEDRSYQRYQEERHEKRPFVALNTRQKTIYWGWRHNNPDRP
jgi:hypothetical protein